MKLHLIKNENGDSVIQIATKERTYVLFPDVVPNQYTIVDTTKAIKYVGDAIYLQQACEKIIKWEEA